MAKIKIFQGSKPLGNEAADTSFNPTSDILSTNVQDAIEEVASKGGGSGIGKYSLPVMTEEMKDAALADPFSGFNEDSSYISVDDGSSLNGETVNNTITSINGSYLYIMMNTI